MFKTLITMQDVKKIAILLMMMFITTASFADISVNFNKAYVSTNKVYGLNTVSIDITTPISASQFTFTQPGVNRFSGNEVGGIISYNDGTNRRILGIINRQKKTGSTVNAFYFIEMSNTDYANPILTGKAFLLINPINPGTIADNTNVGTSSDPSDGNLNDLLDAQPRFWIQPSSTDQTVCLNGTVTPLSIKVKADSAGTATLTNVKWYSNTTASITGGTLISTVTLSGNINTSTITPSNSPVGDLYYFAIVSNNNIGSVTSNVSGKVSVVAAPTISGITGTTTICSVLSTTLTASSSSDLPTYKWFTASTGGTLLYTGPSYTTGPLTINTTYYVDVTNSGGCTSTSRTATTVTVNSAPATPTVSVSAQPTCSVATGTITITAPTGSGMTYSIDGTTYTNTSGIFTGVVAGTYAITARNTSGCTSSSASVTVSSQPATPSTPTVSVSAQPTCSLETGTITITAPTGSGMTYSIDGTTYTNTSGIFTVVVAGTYAVTARNTSGCTSSSTSVTVSTPPVTPGTPTATVSAQPTCSVATGSVSLSGLPGSGSWTVTATGGGNISGSGSSATFSGLAAGIYTFTVSNGTCTSLASTSVTLNAPSGAPTTPTVTVSAQPTCLIATGTITITAPTGSGMTYSIDGTTYTNTSGIFTGVVAGTYVVTARNTSGCTSTSSSVTVNAQPALPATPTVSVSAQPTCSLATGTITITAPTGSGMTYSIDGTNYTNTSGMFTGVVAGTYAVTAKNTSGCTSSSASVTVNTQPALPSTPTVSVSAQPTCSLATGTITITAPTGSGMTYSIDGATYTNTTGIFTGVVAGTYVVTARNTSGCTSTSSSVTVNAQPALPATPTVSVSAQPTCSLATGTITITAPTGSGMTYSIDGTTYTNTTGIFTGVVAGTYVVTAKNTSGCTSTSSSVTVNAQPALPSTPTVSVSAQPTCSLATGTITITAPTGTGMTYSIDGTTYTNTSGIFTGVVAGTYAVTARNTSGCTSTSSSVTVNAQPALPSTPTVSVSAQPTCLLATGTITITAPTGSGMTYSIDGTNYTNTSGIFTGVVAGTYAVTAKNTSGCTSSSASVTVNTQPALPATPTVAVSTQPTCLVATGTITITAPTGSGMTYSIDGTNYTNTSGIFTGVVAGTYAVTAKNTSGCTSSSASVTVNTQPALPATPTVIVSEQPTCLVATGTITITAPTGSGMTYSIDGTNYTNTSGIFTGVVAGTYAVTAKNTSGCTSSSSSVNVNAQPEPPAITSTTGNSRCGAGTVDISASATTGTLNWYTSATGGSSLGSANTYTTAIITATTTYYVDAVANGCTTTIRTPVIANVTVCTLLSPDNNITNVNTTVNGNVSSNDVLPNGGTYGIPIPSSINPTSGNLTMASDGSYSFLSSKTGTYIYQVPVCAIGQTINCPVTSLFITVKDPNVLTNPPAANPDIVVTAINKPITTNVLVNDQSSNLGITLNAASIVILTDPKNGVAKVNSNGTIKYTPTNNFAGNDSLTYRVCDNATPVNCNTANVYYTITPIATAPVTISADDYASTQGGVVTGVSVSGNVLTNDANTDGETVILTATVNTTIPSNKGILTFNSNGSYTFIPAGGFTGPLDVLYTACGGAPQSCSKATLHLLINPSPSLLPDFGVTNIKSALSGNVATNDAVIGATYGTPVASSNNPAGATITLKSDGTYSFTAIAVGVYTFQVPVCNSGQNSNCPLMPLVITVNDPNSITNIPVVNIDVVVTVINTPITTNVLSNDQSSNYGVSLNPASVKITVASKNGTTLVNNDGTIKYTPNNGFIGLDSLTYNVCDNSLPTNFCNTAKVYYTVNAEIASKITNASDDYISTLQSNTVSGNVLTNDTNTGGSSVVLTASILSAVPSAKGTLVLNVNGSYTFTPASTFTGTLDVVYTVCGGIPQSCANATLHILVSAKIPLPPKALNGTYTTGVIGNPANISTTVTNIPNGCVVQYCNVNGSGCSTIAPVLPSVPGVYVWCVRNVDLLSGLYSIPCQYDTITILPTLIVANKTYIAGGIGNPANISSLVTSITAGSKPQWCDVNGNNCTMTPPVLPNIAGVYVWCVKAVDASSGLISTPCLLDTVTILAPITLIDIRKTVDTIQLLSDGSVLVKFKIKTENLMSIKIDSLQVNDDLSMVFGNSNYFKVLSVKTSGGLQSNPLYNGSGVIDLLAVPSYLDAKKTDSIIVSVVVAPNLPSGNYSNSAIMQAKTPYGIGQISSNDPIKNPININNRLTTVFNIPKLDIIIPGGFSPNNDGVDDKFIITRPYGTRISLQIFNRWGNVVYKNDDYKNDWDGRGVNNIMGQYVPNGTYFYTVNAINTLGANRKFAGYVTIVK